MSDGQPIPHRGARYYPEDESDPIVSLPGMVHATDLGEGLATLSVCDGTHAGDDGGTFGVEVDLDATQARALAAQLLAMAAELDGQRAGLS